jgi:ankyrin repeat protein
VLFVLHKKLLAVILLAVLAILVQPAASLAGPLESRLRMAVMNNNIPAVEEALRQGANINYVRDDYQDNPLGMAIAADNMPMVDFLLAKGATPNVHIYGNGIVTSTPLLQAISRQNLSLVQKLLAAGADVNIVSKLCKNPAETEVSPLIQAIVAPYTRDSMAIFALLLQHGANVNYRTSNGDSVLMFTVIGRYSRSKLAEMYDMAEKLLIAGADLKVRNKRGELAMDLALRNRYDEMALLFKQQRFNPQQ